MKENSEKITVGIVNQSEHPVPAYATEFSSGADLHADLKGGFITLRKGQRRLVPTGIFLEMPEYLEAQIRPRSGLAVKKGITVLNAPGTVDADYKGEVFVNLINLGSSEQIISDGEKIAQIVFVPVVRVRFDEIKKEELSQSERGEGGHGSTDEEDPFGDVPTGELSGTESFDDVSVTSSTDEDISAGE